MCKKAMQKGCEHPEKLKGKPEDCTPEQIKECHGDVKKHPCVEKKQSYQINWKIAFSIPYCYDNGALQKFRLSLNVGGLMYHTEIF